MVVAYLIKAEGRQVQGSVDGNDDQEKEDHVKRQAGAHHGDVQVRCSLDS